MGTCMSKDKKAATAAAHTASASSSSSSWSSQCKQIQYPSQDNESTINTVRPSSAEENLPIPKVEPSSPDQGKELTSTDKHVVEIRLPIGSPSKFKACPASATLAARAMADIARPAVKEKASAQSREEEQDAEEEEEEEEGRSREGAYLDKKGSSKFRNPSPPLFYSNYLSRTSFSRDLAAFSRDIASLSSSPLMRSPSVNGAQDLIAAAIKAAHSPLYAQAKPHPNIVFDDYSATRSRSLPKRFYGKESNSNLLPLHKRSTSRDAVMEHLKSTRRKPLIDPPCELALSPRLSVRREEASGEYRVCARQAAARKGHHKPNAHSTPPKTPDIGLSWKKERSPLRRSSTGKVADADQVNHGFLHFQENQNFTQPMQCDSTVLNQGRPALIERSSNCSSWADAARPGSEGSLKTSKKVAKAKVEQNDENFGLGRSSIENEVFGEGFPAAECPNSSLYFSSKPLPVSVNDESDTVVMSMDRVRSIVESLADLNFESAAFSEIEESETEVEGELDLLQLAFHDEFSPRKELEDQQTRNMLLKEAAMDAFARPSFQSSMHPKGLEARKLPYSDLAALMSMRLTEGEVDTLKIRKVLKLLSIAESEMGKEQKNLFYNQLRMVLDSVRIQDDKNSQMGTTISGNMKEKAVTQRANSWPRSIKEPSHDAMSIESGSNHVSDKTPTQNLSLKVINTMVVSPIVSELQEELSLEHPESVHQVIGPCKLDDIQILTQKTNDDLEYPHGEKLRAEVCHTHEANEHIVHQVDESPTVDLSFAHESPVEEAHVREDYCGAEIPNISESQILEENDDFLTKGVNDERGPNDDVDRAACPSANCTLLITEVLHQPQSTPNVEMKEACLHEEVQAEGMECASECETCPPPELSQSRLALQDVHRETHLPEMGEHVSGTCTPIASDDVASDGSFEFRVRSSSASTPLSTPSTPMISSASTPRHLSSLEPPLTAKAIADIWEAFE